MNLPAEFLNMIEKHPLLAPLASDLLSSPETSIRLNPAKKDSKDYLQYQRVPWWTDGYYLNERPAFTFDPALHQGRYYVQDASSMAIAPIIEELATKLGNNPLLYLDSCAAPGGKTTAAVSALPHGSFALANEYDYRRAEILLENVAKWGYPYMAVTRGDTCRFKKLKDTFDIIAADVPCSGEGMMRKEEKAIEQWSPSLVKECASLQREILENLWTSLKPGGYLIYSTCTFNLSEDEDNINWLIENTGAESVKLDCLEAHTEIAKGIDTKHHCYRFIPGRIKGEGLFIAAVRKPGTYTHTPLKSATSKQKAKIDLSEWLSPDIKFAFNAVGEEVYALPAQWEQTLSPILKKLDAISPGLHIATIKGKDVIPSAELALNTALDADAFPTYEVDYAHAIAYLQKEAFALDEAPKGYVLLTYQSHPLGFVKNLGNRANNLYPKPWRILSQQIPSAPPIII